MLVITTAAAAAAASCFDVVRAMHLSVKHIPLQLHDTLRRLVGRSFVIKEVTMSTWNEMQVPLTEGADQGYEDTLVTPSGV